jgi:hypothetical protein
MLGSMLRLANVVAIVVALAAGGCGGSSGPHATATGGCNGVPRAAQKVPVPGLTPAQVCAALGAPKAIAHNGQLVMWRYARGVLVVFADDRAQRAVAVYGAGAGGKPTTSQLGISEPEIVDGRGAMVP